MLISAAAAGLGIALVPKFFVDGQLDALGLVMPCNAATVGDSAYYLVYPTELSHSKPLESFREWLLEQASAYAAPKGDAQRDEADVDEDEDVE
jgi:DNA-binding transcriptional LysR family regulator